MGKYALGIDFGTLSARAILLDVDSGTEQAEAVSEYADGVIERNLPNSNIKLENKWALQNPNDYITSFVSVCREISATGYNLKGMMNANEIKIAATKAIANLLKTTLTFEFLYLKNCVHAAPRATNAAIQI